MGNYGDTFSAAVAAELRAQRARVQVTIGSIVASTGLSKSAVLNYLNGKRDIPTAALVEISRALNTTAHAIFESAEQALEND